MEKRHLQRMHSSLASPSPCPPPSREAEDELIKDMPLAPPWLAKNKKRLSKQLSMCETPRDLAWEKRRRQMLRLERKKNGVFDRDDLTDEDWNELKGCIELGFAFNEEDSYKLCGTLPALDLYFAVNRQLSPRSPQSSSGRASTSSLGGRSSSFGSPNSTDHTPDTWKICSPGEDPKQVKAKLRHWAQAVACTVMQSYPNPSMLEK